MIILVCVKMCVTIMPIHMMLSWHQSCITVVSLMINIMIC